jgi:hypothetical protein
MLKGMSREDGMGVLVSIVGAVVAFVVVYKICRHATDSDASLIFGPILGTYAAVAVPYAVVRWMAGKGLVKAGPIPAKA